MKAAEKEKETEGNSLVQSFRDTEADPEDALYAELEERKAQAKTRKARGTPTRSLTSWTV